MWNSLVAFIRLLWDTGRATEKNTRLIEEIQTQNRQFALAMQEIVSELRHQREMSERDRENLLLRLEIELLKLERRLPSGDDSSSSKQ